MREGHRIQLRPQNGSQGYLSTSSSSRESNFFFFFVADRMFGDGGSERKKKSETLRSFQMQQGVRKIPYGE